MAKVITTNNFNPQSLRAAGFYVIEKPRTGFKKQQAVNTVGFVGTADWNLFDQPVEFYSPEEHALKFGPYSSKAATDPFDMANAVGIVFSQTAEGGSIRGVGVRVGDGTHAKASYPLLDTTPDTPLTGATLQAVFAGDVPLQAVLEPGSLTGTTTVKIFGHAGSIPETYPNIPSVGAGVFWPALASQINNGNLTRGYPSDLVRVNSPSASAIAPALGTYNLTGGASGRTGVDAADLIGTDGRPKTGAYSIRSRKPKVNMLLLCGLSDTSVYGSVKALAESERCIVFFDFPKGTSSSTARTNKKTYAVDSNQVAFCYNWGRVFDGVNKMSRLVPPSYFAAGRLASLNVNESLCNKQAFGVISTERDDAATGTPWSDEELGDLQVDGIIYLKRGIERSDEMFGFGHGMSSDTSVETADLAHSRIRDWIIQSSDGIVGPFIGEVLTTDTDDPVRAGIKTSGDAFFSSAENNSIVDEYVFECDNENNPDDEITAGYTYIDVGVKPIGHNFFTVMRLQYAKDAAPGKNALNGQAL